MSKDIDAESKIVIFWGTVDTISMSIYKITLLGYSYAWGFHKAGAK